MPTLADHALLLFLVGFFPLYVMLSWFPRLRRATAAGRPGARLRGYGEVMVEEWLMAGAVVWIWLHTGRAFADLGFAAPSGARFVLSLGLAALIAYGIHWQARWAARNSDARLLASRQLVALDALLPHSWAELRTFTALSLTAGICEEILARGFLIWYLEQYGNLWTAILFSSLLFGLGHAYQGPRGVFLSGALGLVFAGLYVLSGSLWIPMALHAFIDARNGRLAYELFRGGESERLAGQEPSA